MEQQILEKHKFQFISFIPVYHKHGRRSPVCINNDSHLMHITCGTAVINVDGKSNRLHRGAVVFIPRQTTFVMGMSPDSEMLNIHYQIWLRGGEFLDDKLCLPYVFYPDYFDSCEQKLRRMMLLSENTLPNMMQKASLSYDIISQHLSSCELVKTHRHVIADKIDQVAKYLRSDDCLVYDIEKVVQLACLSKSQLNRRFKQVFGISPHKYWEQQLLRKICIKIEQTQKTFTELAENFAFSSPYYFSRWFKKNAGCSPSSFRNAPTIY
ncbi:MAG: helix-turn-helix transcriptional regulator [Victivallaceae bacterium]|nr:helix-turn-helix transcriptional regulator [Victivallaceae bacterium]